MKKTILLFAFLSCVMILSPLANATTLTFDDLSTDSGSEVANPYMESDFVLTADENGIFYSWGSLSDDYTGSAAIYNDSYTDTILTAEDGSLFNLTSIDLSELWNYEYGDDDVFDLIVTGTYTDGTNISAYIALDLDFGYETIAFDETFSFLTSVTFSSGYYQIDNIEASTVPEPASMMLLGSGLLVAAAISRRRTS
ncbi:PEP-CTERM sorting domain-containing protein [Desulfospira joergensenii]|uniref:PEP-CTERM sorting domain-containing protein n=1 Tax=Desulfospira joergensenii TaxID=53329 RepID=UPI0003B48AAC|nr:PEP-CTERM sorting domain-containing protein [Desulfospira joergensenii]